jgi:hypothetical protein
MSFRVLLRLCDRQRHPPTAVVESEPNMLRQPSARSSRATQTTQAAEVRDVNMRLVPVRSTLDIGLKAGLTAGNNLTAPSSFLLHESCQRVGGDGTRSRARCQENSASLLNARTS